MLLSDTFRVQIKSTCERSKIKGFLDLPSFALSVIIDEHTKPNYVSDYRSHQVLLKSYLRIKNYRNIAGDVVKALAHDSQVSPDLTVAPQSPDAFSLALIFLSCFLEYVNYISGSPLFCSARYHR